MDIILRLGTKRYRIPFWAQTIAGITGLLLLGVTVYLVGVFIYYL